MRRLNVHDRKKLVDAALKRAFGDLEEQYSLREDMLVKVFYAILFKPEVFKAISVLGSDWLTYQTSHRFNVCGMTFDLRSREKMAYPRGKSHPIGVIKDEVQKERVLTLLDEQKKLAEKKSQVKAQLEALVGSVTTLKRLKEIWPEGKEVWSVLDDKEPEKIYLPAVQMEELNATLRLP